VSGYPRPTNALSRPGPGELGERMSEAVKRFRAYGEAGLCDGRADNGVEKLSERYRKELDRVVRGNPEDYGWRRPTGTRELLVETLVRRTGVRVHPATLSRALARVQARRGRPKPAVGCP
jgi:hypothetical protein